MADVLAPLGAPPGTSVVLVVVDLPEIVLHAASSLHAQLCMYHPEDVLLAVVPSQPVADE